MYRLLIDLPDSDETVVKVERWYDKASRTWVVQALNAAGEQVGDAEVVGTKGDAMAAERQMRAKAGL